MVSEVYALLSVVALYMRPYRTTHRASVQNHCCPIRIGLTAFNFGNTIARGQNEHGKKKKDFLSTCFCATLLHCLSIFRSGSNFSHYLLLVVFLFRHFVSPISQGCVCCTFVCRVLPGDIPVRSCCRNSTLGLCPFFFHHQIKRTQVC